MKKKELYVVCVVLMVCVGVLKKCDGAKTSEATASKYASGNLFVVFVMVWK